jgi:hypothetical protein
MHITHLDHVPEVGAHLGFGGEFLESWHISKDIGDW